jgi:predicted transcriptional regulator of viral defense system
MKFNHLSDYITYLISKGELVLSKNSTHDFLERSDAAIRNSIKRQVKAKQLLPLLRGYYLIIPPEYAQLGFVPPELFIDDLMKAVKVSYYVGILSAASFHGASHQAVQIFQVIVEKQLKPISLRRTRIVFYYNRFLKDIPLQKLKTDRGPMNVSTPEATAFDLVRYVHQSGNLNHVATVLKELAENLRGDKLKKTAQIYPVVYAQRLGYLLDFFGYDKISKSLSEYVKDLNPLYTPLRPGREAENSEKDLKWRLFINERIESDL